ncbi:superoxide dismutase family protein [Roseivivax isoporae]|uniref:Superoxide dismutase [Cu-Zn] n=1 Tax=Roseivivax isoporae LMG 25204 TaxID=1449351 RepID=X7F5M3_9RHOB|nr:superoxide dismutase family protein [Roseivivax isoporae]ETX28075.1 superoxide dismutase [Roseivivax isoporae LMG 25204]
MKAIHAAILAAGIPALAAAQTDSGPGTGADDGGSATAMLQGTDGTEHGTVNIQQTPSGQVMVTLDLTDIPEGPHGFHFHETGDCSADDFSSAGGHIAGDAEHGVLVEAGPHPGDFPNITAGSDGIVQVSYFNERIDVEDHLMDEDGAAVVVHLGADDYASQPAGDAGDRIACGEIRPAG